MKHRVNAFEYAALNDALKSEYTLQQDGSYTVNLDGMFVTDKDPTHLMNALEKERQEHAQTKSKFDSIISERDAAKREADLAKASKSGDVEAIKKTMEEQLQQMQAKFDEQSKAQAEQMRKHQEMTAEQFRRTEATKIATELFGRKAEAFLPVVMQGLVAKTGEFGAPPTLEIVDGNGIPILGGNRESYKQKFLTDPLYKDYIVVSNASGGSANDGKQGLPVSQKSDGTVKTYKDYTPGELFRLKQSDPEGFKKLQQTRN